MNAGGSVFLTRAHRRLREKVREFAEAEVRPHIGRLETGRAVEEELVRHIAAQGWLGVTIPRRFGGMAGERGLARGHLAKTVVLEELSRVSGAMGAALQASQLGTAKLLHFGTEEQRNRWLPKVAAGEVLPTIATTEPGCGGHVLGMVGTAVRDGDHYLLNTRKIHVGNSHIGDVHGVIVRTGDGSGGLTAFLVEAGTPGLTATPHEPAMGLHGFGFGELTFTDCRVPLSARIGEEGQGLDVAYSSSVLYGRPNLAAVALGIHQALLDTTVNFCRKRERYGAPLHEIGVVRDRLGRMHSRLMTARTLLYEASHLLDQGRPCDAELMNAKLINTESVQESARDAMDIHAAAGLSTDSPVEQHFRDAWHLAAPAGTSDIQRVRLAEAALGTSRSDWSTRIRPIRPAN